MEKRDINPMFANLVGLLSAMGWQGLGKIPNQVTQKIERNLEAAKLAIEILVMLREKTKNNLTQEEERLLSNTIADLQLNYVDEVSKEKKNTC